MQFHCVVTRWRKCATSTAAAGREVVFTLHPISQLSPPINSLKRGKTGRVMTSFPFSQIRPGVHGKMFALLATPVLGKCRASEPSFFNQLIVVIFHLTFSFPLFYSRREEPLPSPDCPRKACMLCLGQASRLSLLREACKRRGETCPAGSDGDLAWV